MLKLKTLFVKITLFFYVKVNGRIWTLVLKTKDFQQSSTGFY